MSYTILAADWGYSYTKTCTNGVKRVFPSTVGAGFDISFSLKSRTKEESMTLITPSGTYFVGELAVEQSSLFLNSIAENRLDDATDALIKATLGLCIPTDGDVRLVTGLPPKYYASTKEDWLRFLRRRHQFTLNGKTRDITITHVTILPQLVGTMIDLTYNGKGTLIDNDYSSGVIGVIDPGFGTTDFGLFNKMKYKEEYKDSIRHNMQEVCKNVANMLYNQYGYVNDELFRMNDIVQTGNVTIHSRIENVAHIVDWTRKTVALSLVKHAQDLWLSRFKVDRIVLTGGGGESLYPFMKDVLPVEKVSDAQTANVRGYYKRAMTQWG